MSKYFTPSEFRKCTPSCSIDDMDKDFLNTLDAIRESAGIPLVLNSAYRTPSYEKSKGRTGTSSHCEGKAVDIRCNNYANRFKIIKAALDNGITRIGIGKTYIHIDASDNTHTNQVVWDYYE